MGFILTANQRLARAIGGEPLATWLRAQCSRPVLSSAQQELLWRRIIAATPEGASLLDLRGTARSAMEAWRLVHQYHLPLDGRFEAHEDWAAFRAWAGEYDRVCEEKDWLDEARLADAVREAVVTGAVDVPRPVLLAGFDELTPQQRDLADALGAEAAEVERIESTVTRAGCPDADSELRRAAEWARDLVRGGGAQSIGIVLLRVGVGRGRIERIFDEALHPERMSDPAPTGARDYHISIPDRLAEYPLVHAALLALQLAGRERWAIDDAGLLLRSPFFGGGVSDAAARAGIDGRLRRSRRAYVTREAGGIALSPAVGGARLPSEWADVFKGVLKEAGFPGDATLSSPEYQVLGAWHGLLRDFASLDAAAGRVTYGEAVARLEEMAEASHFQPQDPGAPIQIMGALEAAGARFDGLWICGATDEAWPEPPHPHPFLPLSLQRERELPHSSPEREMEFAVRTFARLKSSAPRVVVSWAERSGSVDFPPSTLLEGIPIELLSPTVPAGRPRLELEQIVDEMAPPLATSEPRGGTRILERQSACPFQAVAYFRLNAQPLEGAEPGLSAADRGSAIHEALRLFWEEVRDQATLRAMRAEAVREVAARAAVASLDKPFRGSQGAFEARLRELETERFTNILVEWAELEKARAPFRVASRERERTIRIAGLEIAARVDRVDELADGRQVILDYKATAPSTAAWDGDRPDEPQLPLYAISNEAPVAGLAFAQVGPDGLRFKGLAADADVLPGVKAADSLRDQIAEWRRVLEPIAGSFARGFAAVDPKKGRTTCERCGLTSLCRVTEDADADA